MTAQDVFPKVSGDCGYNTEWNSMYAGGLAGYTVINASMENAMNITRLQYCVSLTDISHDYMVVDSFTQNCGYNATVCVASTTSTHVSPGINGYYSSYNQSVVPVACLFCCVSIFSCLCGASRIQCSFNFGGFNCSINTGNTGITTQDYRVCVCVNTSCSLTGVTNFCFYAICCAVGCRSCVSGYSAGTEIFCISNSQDNFGLCCVFSCNETYSCIVTNCYCYTCVSSNCWCFYCNGIGKCQVCLTAFPQIIFYSTHLSSSDRYCFNHLFCITNVAFSCVNSKIQTNNVTWASPIKTTYLDLDKYGTGTVVYNVINAADNSCICCNLLPKCLYTMTCCVPCHRYEIIQCSDAASCIKSYAVAVGV